MWSGLVFSITFPLLRHCFIPFWGGLADRKGRKIMLLRSALGMAIIMALMGVAQNVWQFLILRAPRPAGRIYSQRECADRHPDPRHKSGWALGTLSTGGVSGALLGTSGGRLAGGQRGCARCFSLRQRVVPLLYRY